MRSRTRRKAVALLALSATGLSALAARAADTGFNQDGAGPYDYDEPLNWVNGDVNGVWHASLALTATPQTVTFDSNLALTTGLTFDHDGGNVTLRGTGVNRTVTLGGDIVVTPDDNRTITFGSVTANQGLDVDLGNAVRRFSVENADVLTFANNVTNGTLVVNGGRVNMNGTANALSALRLRNGEMAVTAVGTANTAFNVSGALTIDGASATVGGVSSLILTPAAQRNLALAAASLDRAHRGVLFVRGNNLGGTLRANGVTNVMFAAANAPTLVGGDGATDNNDAIIPWAVGGATAGGGATTFVTYGATGLRPLAAAEFDAYDTTHNAAVTGTDRNVRADNASAGTVTFAGDNTVNSLYVGNTATGGIRLEGGTLAVTSGAVYIASNTASVIDLDLDFGGREGVIGYTKGKASTISGGIAGSAGVTFYQPNTLAENFSGGTGLSLTGASTYVGDTTVLGRLGVTNAGALPGGSARPGDLYVYGILDVTGSFTFNALNGTGQLNKSSSGSNTITLGGDATTDVDGDFAGVIAQNGTTSLRKVGLGTQILGGANTYTGATTVDGGTLLVNGSITSSVTVNNAATLGGTGTITGSATVGATAFLSPGASIESLDITANATVNGRLVIEVDDADPLRVDLLAVGGALTITSATVDFDALSTLDDTAYVFATYGSLPVPAFAQAVDLPSGYKIDYAYNGNQIALVPVPEPAGAVLAMGVVGLLGMRRRRRG